MIKLYEWMPTIRLLILLDYCRSLWNDHDLCAGRRNTVDLLSLTNDWLYFHV
jgi:hypothetical protein